jgi:hypothetical protein
MENLAGYEPTVPAILELNLLKQLVVLAGWVIRSDTLSCRKLDVETPCSREHYESAFHALHAISQWPEGVAALADTEVFEELRQLAKEMTSEYLTQKLYTILDNITRYKAGNPDSVHEEVELWMRNNTYL